MAEFLQATPWSYISTLAEIAEKLVNAVDLSLLVIALPYKLHRSIVA